MIFGGIPLNAGCVNEPAVCPELIGYEPLVNVCVTPLILMSVIVLVVVLLTTWNNKDGAVGVGVGVGVSVGVDDTAGDVSLGEGVGVLVSVGVGVGVTLFKVTLIYTGTPMFHAVDADCINTAVPLGVPTGGTPIPVPKTNPEP